MRAYLDETGLQVYSSTEKLLEDVVNETYSEEPWSPSEYSNDPEYGEVDEELFDMLEEI